MGLYVLKFPYRKILLPLAKKLKFIDPDILSYAATIITIITAACYYFSLNFPFLLILAIILTFTRMTLNTIDGVIAIEQKKDSLIGEIVNALPDRYSDVILLVGIAISPCCNNILGILGLSSVFLVSYTGMLGKALGVEWQHHGPLGKVERLIILMIFSFIQYIHINNIYLFGFSLSALEWCMVIFIILGQITVYNRLKGMLAQIYKIEWIRKEKYKAIQNKILVVYDSATGNTEKIANEISKCLHADIVKVNDIKDADIKKYDVFIIGTPDIRKIPTQKIIDFITKYSDTINHYAVFVTWGMPVWGPISLISCFNFFGKILKKKPIASFSCKGFHVKYKTYTGHPDDKDLLAGYNFGIKIAKRLGVKL